MRCEVESKDICKTQTHGIEYVRGVLPYTSLESFEINLRSRDPFGGKRFKFV